MFSATGDLPCKRTWYDPKPSGTGKASRPPGEAEAMPPDHCPGMISWLVIVHIPIHSRNNAQSRHM